MTHGSTMLQRLELSNPWQQAAIYRLRQTDSTMEDARRLLAGGCASGTVVVAEFQREGRGRAPGRVWDARAGRNLLFTVVLKETDLGPLAAPQRLPLLAGLAVALSVERRFGVAPGIKWPNDLLVRGRKLAGILCEAIAEGGSLGVLIGVGVNCNQRRFDDALTAKATSLALLLRRSVDRDALLLDILGNLKTWIGSQKWREAVVERLYGLQRTATLHPPGGAAANPPPWPLPGGAVRGRIVGLAADGALLFQPEPGPPPDTAPQSAVIAVYAGELDFED